MSLVLVCSTSSWRWCLLQPPSSRLPRNACLAPALAGQGCEATLLRDRGMRSPHTSHVRPSACAHCYPSRHVPRTNARRLLWTPGPRSCPKPLPSSGVDSLWHLRRQDPVEPPSSAPAKLWYERPVANELMLTAGWVTHRAWKWKREAHNLDSRVALCSLEGSGRFNVADAPSRDRPDDEPCRPVPWWDSSIASNDEAEFDVEGLFGLPPCAVVCRWRGSPESAGLRPHPRVVFTHCKFDSQLGYPGERPSTFAQSRTRILVRGPRHDSKSEASDFNRNWAGVTGRTLTLAKARATSRAQTKPSLPTCRPPDPKSAAQRVWVLGRFQSWLEAHKELDLQLLLNRAPADPKEVNDVLETCCQHLRKLGAPHWHWVESLNGISGARGVLRGSLTVARGGDL